MSFGFIGYDEEGQPIMLKPAPDPSLSLIRELRDALVEWSEEWTDEETRCECPRCAKTRILIARATVYLREHGAEAQEPGGSRGERREQ